MNTFPTFKNALAHGKTLALVTFIMASVAMATPAMADRKRTTVIRETVYHTPVYHSSYRTVVQPSVIIPISNSVYVGLGSSSYVNTGHRQTTVHRHYDRYQDNYYDRGFRHPGRGNAFGHRNKEPARGRWSGADRHRDVIYVDRDGRRNSSYREAERRSVVIRERSR